MAPTSASWPSVFGRQTCRLVQHHTQKEDLVFSKYWIKGITVGTFFFIAKLFYFQSKIQIWEKYDDNISHGQVPKVIVWSHRMTPFGLAVNGHFSQADSERFEIDFHDLERKVLHHKVKWVGPHIQTAREQRHEPCYYVRLLSNLKYNFFTLYERNLTKLPLCI